MSNNTIPHVDEQQQEQHHPRHLFGSVVYAVSDNFFTFLGVQQLAALRVVSKFYRDCVAQFCATQCVTDLLVPQFRGCTVVELEKARPPALFPSWTIFLNFAGGIDAFVEVVQKRSPLSGAVLMVPQHTSLPPVRWFLGGLEEWQVAAMSHRVGSQAVFCPYDNEHHNQQQRIMDPQQLFRMLCGRRYCWVISEQDPLPDDAVYFVCLSDEEIGACLKRIPSSEGVPLMTNLMPSDFDSSRGQTRRMMNRERVAFTQNDAYVRQATSSFCCCFSSCDCIEVRGTPGFSVVCDNFLYHAEAMCAVDLSGLCNCTSIFSNFMSSCREIRRLDLTGLNNITEIGNNFMDNCSGLTEINLWPLSNVRKVGDGFLLGCTALTEIDVSPLFNLEEIGNFFLSGCTSITKIRHLSKMKRVKKIGNGFLSGCGKISQAAHQWAREHRGVGGNSET